MTLTGELSWQRLRRSAVDFYSKNEKLALWATLSLLKGNVRTPSIARWKARGRLYILRNWTFFAISYGWDVMSGNLLKSAFFKGVGHFERRFQREGSVAHQPLLIALLCGIKISAVHHLVLSQSTRVTDIQTDRITTSKTALAYARAVKPDMDSIHVRFFT